MQIKVYSILALTFMLLSCGNNHSITMNEACSIANNQIKIPNLEDSTVLYYSGVFSDVKMVPLESKNNCMLSTITKLYVTNDGNYVVYDQSSGNVAIYGKEGSFLSRIGQKGRRKSEYTIINDVVYDRYNDNVIIWDNPRKKLLIYSMNGKFISDVDVPMWTGAFELLDKEHFIFYVDDENTEKERSKDERHQIYKYKYVVMDRHGKETKEYGNLHYTVKGVMPIFEKSLRLNNNRLISHQEYSPIIFSFENDTINYEYAMSFENSTISEDWFDLDEDEFTKKIHQDEDLAYCYDFFESKDYYINVLCRDHLYLNIMSKDLNISRTGYCAVNDMSSMKSLNKWLPGEILPVAVYNNNCYFAQDPSTLQKLYEELSKAIKDNKVSITSHDMDQLQQLSKNYNPILIVGKLR